MHYDSIILGAGASGLVCAMQAAARDLRVLVLDHGPRPGAKIRVAGGGRCNVTNLAADADSYLCRNPHFVKSALARFTPWDAWTMLAELGIPLVEEDKGRVFTDLGKKGGRQVAQALLAAARDRGAEFMFDALVEDVHLEGGAFHVQLPGERLVASTVVLALGGRSWPQVGASDLGHRLARSFGLPLTPVRPGLTPLEAGGELRQFCASLAGVSLPVGLQVIDADERPTGPAIHDELLFTHRGISGPAVLDASLFWTKGRSLRLDLLPGVDISAALNATPRMELKNALARLLPTRLAQALCQRHQWGGICAGLGKGQLQRLETTLHAWPFTPSKASGWDKAEVTLGGVDTNAVSSRTLEARELPGLYLTGEVLDVTGRLGGCNLQWAWSSGWVAGSALQPAMAT